jgi:lipopolysaccharide biosynthesis glycosyltransferase
MYYRLLAYKFLPPDLERILYLDPDILVINPIRELYETDIDGYLYAAAYHDMLPISGITNCV